MQKKRRLLILGGTTEASLLVRQLNGNNQIQLVYSLAGVTKNPVLPDNIHTHMGGFGGVEGMVYWLKSNGIDGIIDVTHPYACQITANAHQAAEIAYIPFLRLERSAWKKEAGDQWIEVLSLQEAVDSLGRIPRKVFLTIGRKDLLPFKNGQVLHHYWIRSVDRPEEKFLPDYAEVITAKGPFDIKVEQGFLKTYGIEYIVSKNSGGKSVYAKIEAARLLNIPVIMVQRNCKQVFPFVDNIDDVLRWVSDQFH